MSDLVEASSVSVKTMADGTLRLSVDIEPRFARAGFGLFGSPGTPMVLGRLKAAGQVEEKPVEPQNRMGPLCHWVVMRCKEELFVYFMAPIYDKAMGGDGSGWGDVHPFRDFGGDTEKWAAHAVKIICGVKSRKDIDGNEMAETLLNTQIRQPYMEWLQRRGTR